jgi:hypothetical protein
VWDACHGSSYDRTVSKDPLVSVVKGNPTDEELAALLAVLASQSSKVDEAPPPPSMTAWVRSSRPAAGPASWRTSGLPTAH